ncbi:MAG: SEC-C domain-containing protein [Deltaproteobacteria bacterium]|nr:SEC-C domain-containing protein [Deltaproteobacteria bacterium]
METFSSVNSISDHFKLFYYHFLNRGGRQFLALLIFLISIAPFHLKKPFIPIKSVGRNDPCTCGSGKKYKKCCMK